MERLTREETFERMTPGTILHYSWGYGQTNCDFFEVVRQVGSTMVLLQPIKSRVEETGFMSGKAWPVPGSKLETFGSGANVNVYSDAPIRKRVMPGGISMDFGVATITDPEKGHYVSWYH